MGHVSSDKNSLNFMSVDPLKIRHTDGREMINVTLRGLVEEKDGMIHMELPACKKTIKLRPEDLIELNEN